MKFLLATDLDNTLVGDDVATYTLNERIQAQRDRFCLVYATGRSHASTRDLIAEKHLLEPDYLIAGVGSEIYHKGILDPVWAESLSQNWQRDAIETITQQFSLLKPQSSREQNPWKISFTIDSTPATPVTLQRLEQELSKTQLSWQIIFSSNRDLDILPKNSNKGKALTYLQTRLGMEAEATVVCGDSGNDIGMFEQKVCGVIVANAQPELLKWHQEWGQKHHYLAQSPYAWGMLEGLQFFWGIES